MTRRASTGPQHPRATTEGRDLTEAAPLSERATALGLADASLAASHAPQLPNASAEDAAQPIPTQAPAAPAALHVPDAAGLDATVAPDGTSTPTHPRAATPEVLAPRAASAPVGAAPSSASEAATMTAPSAPPALPFAEPTTGGKHAAHGEAERSEPSHQRDEPTSRVATAPAGATPARQATEGVDPNFSVAQMDETHARTSAPARIGGRIRKRAATDLAELRQHYRQHDIFVLLLALLLMIGAGRWHRKLVTPPTKTFSERGLQFVRSTAWLDPKPLPASGARILRTWEPQPPGPQRYHVAFTSTLDPNARFEVAIEAKPAWNNVVTTLELERRNRWGELYALERSSVRTIAGHEWLRTVFQYAHVSEHGDVPTVERAVEFATVDREQLYTLTFYGSAAAIARMEEVTVPSLRVESQTGLPLVPQGSRLALQKRPAPVSKAMRSTVMVVAVDLQNGKLTARGGGSGVVVASDGSILTNYHVIHDRDGRLHEAFVIARSNQEDRAPLLLCAGKPSRAKFSAELDLALLKCDMDLDGRLFDPRTIDWPVPPLAKVSELSPGARLWILGYPDVGGGGLTQSLGLVSGFSVDEAGQRDYIKTDAAISHGNSGGPTLNDRGELVGIAAAFRVTTTVEGGVVETAKTGLVRSLDAANELLAIAKAGWTPREGKNAIVVEPSVEAQPDGVRLSTTITDFANGEPVREALVMVLRPGILASAIDMNRLDDQVLAWGRSNSMGEVHLKQPVPVPGTYSVVVLAKRYQPLYGDNELTLDADTPQDFDPWGGVTLEAR